MNLSQVLDLLRAEEVEQTLEWNSEHHANMLHRAIGQDYIEARRPGSGNSLEYTARDVRRVVAHFRLINLCGVPRTTQGQRMFQVVKNIAMSHSDGYVYFDGEQANWVLRSNDPEVVHILQSGKAALIVPCYMKTEDPNYGTIAVETDES